MEYQLTAKVILNPKLEASPVTAEAVQIILADRLSKLRNLMFTVSEIRVKAIAK